MLPESVVKAFHQLRQSPEFPNAWLATVGADGGPRVRTVRVCGFNFQQHLVYISTDVAQVPTQELEGEPRGELCLSSLAGPAQLRLRGGLSPLEEGSMRSRFWVKLSMGERQRAYGAATQEPPWHFLVLALQIDLVDRLDLGVVPPSQAAFQLRGDRFEPI